MEQTVNREYEAVVVFSSDLDEQGVKGQLERFSGIVATHGGTVRKQDIWGRRQLAQRIKKKDSGIYSLVIFDGDNTLVAALDRQLKINDSVLRHMIVRKNKFAPDMQYTPRPEDSAAFDSVDTSDDLSRDGD